jgi:hypothetical protein
VATYSVYGVTLASDLEFTVPLPPGRGPIDVEFICQLHPPLDVDLAEASGVCGTDIDADWADDLLSYYRVDGDLDVVRLRDHADYYLWDDRIVCHLHDPGLRYLVENQLFGGVFAFWLERRGTLAFHASAVVIDGVAVAFFAPGGGGKTTTASAMAAAGHPLLTEDLLPVTWDGKDLVAHPGYPMVRMWPEQALHFTGQVDTHPLWHPVFTKRRVWVGDAGFATFHREPTPLRHVYFLRRVDGASTPIGIESLLPQTSLIDLLTSSFLPVEVERFRWQPRRLPALAAVLEQVEVRSIHYPSGFDRLSSLVAAVEADVRAASRHESRPEVTLVGRSSTA